MRDFDYSALAGRTWDNETLSYLTAIHEYKGKQELFLQSKPVELDRLEQIARIQSTESSNRIEGIVTTDARLRELIADTTTPRNRDEKEILGYRNVLNLIHESHEYIPLTPNTILQLHRDLMRYTEFSFGGQFKRAPNEIDTVDADGVRRTLFQPLSPLETPDAVAAICDAYRRALGEGRVDALLLIPCFVLDFLCIHPFTDGNGRMSRLLTLLLLYQNGYIVGRYVSIEKAIADTKDDYYDALAAADQGWRTGDNDPKPFIRYMLGVILACYRDFEGRITIAQRSGAKSTACDVVKTFAMQQLGTFTKRDVMAGCPSLGSSSVEAALKKLASDGMLTRLGRGRSTRYAVRMPDADPAERPETAAQS